ncbi:uncharacterized protein [Anoplolepis gracilipes]
MKVLLIAVVLLVAVEAHQGWPFYNFGGPGQGHNPGRGPWAYPQQQSQNTIFGSDVEWVCQNPKTKDMMIIATDNTRQQYPNGGSQQWQNVPSGHQADHYQRGNRWTQPIIVVQEPTNTNDHRLPPLFPQTSETPNNNNNNYNDNQPQSTTPSYHGGEGLIDIRVAQ